MLFVPVEQGPHGKNCIYIPPKHGNARNDVQFPPNPFIAMRVKSVRELMLTASSCLREDY